MTTTTTETLADFITRLAIKMTATRTDRNPHMSESGDMDHWRVTLSRPGAGTHLRLAYSMGRGYNGNAPTRADVLDCLASDASGVENTNGFADWCNDYGYDTDSRKAERTYKVCERQTERLKAFLGDDYETLLWHTERL